jgi:hypothetical protein
MFNVSQSVMDADHMGSDRDDENSLAAMPLSEPQEGLTLPPIAAKANDLEVIRQEARFQAAQTLRSEHA